MMLKIIKRDGRKVHFDPLKIRNAIEKAIFSVGEKDIDVDKLTGEVVLTVNNRYSSKTPTVENIQDIVEEVLIGAQLSEIAKAYILYREERSKIRNQKTRLMKTFHDIT